MDAKLNAGKLAEGRQNHADSMAAEGEIPFGKALKLGTDPEKQVTAWDGAASSDKFAGIAQFSIAGDLDNSKYEDGDPVTVLKTGVIWVQLSADAASVTKGDPVAVRDDGLFEKGALSSGSSGSYGVDIENAKFKSAGDAGDVVKVEIDLPSATNVVQL